MIVDDENAGTHLALIGSEADADKSFVNGSANRLGYQQWLAGEILLLLLLSAILALFVAYPSLPHSFELPALRLVVDAITMVAALMVAVLAVARLSAESEQLDLLLCSGFALAGLNTLAFRVAPRLGGAPLHRAEAWAGIAGEALAALLIAVGAFSYGRIRQPGRSLFALLLASVVLLGVIWATARGLGMALPPIDGSSSNVALKLAFAGLALLRLVACVGFGMRYRRRGSDLDRWLALAETLWLYAALWNVFYPVMASDEVSHAHFLSVLAFGLLLVGVWRAIRSAEFGRAVAEERTRVAREIHDGLAQYLFALSTHVNRLRTGADIDEVLPRIEEAARLAQQEARFAVLALSSAGGESPFEASLRRYIEFLSADGVLEVDLELEEGIDLAPDEQIEVFRIVQEGLANVRKHANAHWAEVTIGRRDSTRFVRVRDDGDGFDTGEATPGHGLRNMRTRVDAIAGSFRLTSNEGMGTALEVTLRSA
jgi:signal transduction histidine kinase